MALIQFKLLQSILHCLQGIPGSALLIRIHLHTHLLRVPSYYRASDLEREGILFMIHTQFLHKIGSQTHFRLAVSHGISLGHKMDMQYTEMPAIPEG